MAVIASLIEADVSAVADSIMPMSLRDRDEGPGEAADI